MKTSIIELIVQFTLYLKGERALPKIPKYRLDLNDWKSLRQAYVNFPIREQHLTYAIALLPVYPALANVFSNSAIAAGLDKSMAIRMAVALLEQKKWDIRSTMGPAGRFYLKRETIIPGFGVFAFNSSADMPIIKKLGNTVFHVELGESKLYWVIAGTKNCRQYSWNIWDPSKEDRLALTETVSLKRSFLDRFRPDQLWLCPTSKYKVLEVAEEDFVETWLENHEGEQLRYHGLIDRLPELTVYQKKVPTELLVHGLIKKGFALGMSRSMWQSVLEFTQALETEQADYKQIMEEVIESATDAGLIPKSFHGIAPHPHRLENHVTDYPISKAALKKFA